MKKSLNIIGISIATTNENGKSAQDLSALWNKFYTEKIAEKIPGTLNHKIYAIYTDYENDFRGKYTAIIGMEVSSLHHIPEGLVGRAFPEEYFTEFIAKGEMPAAIINTWEEIWQRDKDLHRAYTYDFEVYTDKPSEVSIFISVKEN